MNEGVLARYRALLDEGKIEADPAQAELAERLDALALRLEGYRPAPRVGVFGRLIGAKPVEPPRGLYIHGEVGRGKTFLMDLFFDAAERRRRSGARISTPSWPTCMRAFTPGASSASAARSLGDDPIAPVAAALAAEASLLCFDEFAVRDIADAMILARLFGALFAAGVVVVATSNVAPRDLYKDGLNRALFLPFLGLMARADGDRRTGRAHRLPVAEVAPRAGLLLPRRRSAPTRRWTKRSCG